MDIQLGNPSSLNLLWVAAAAVGTMVFAVVARRRALARFATANLVGRLADAGSSARQFAKRALVAAALVALVLALLDVRWGKVWREVPQKGIEVMFVLDVSRSMLAEDASPNRLQRAKQQIGDMLDEMAGDRVGLVAFAGDARQLVPLTSHYHDFKQTLSEAGPQDVDRGGSRLGDALKLAADGFLDQTGDHKAIVVVTDGDDQESEPVKVAEQLHRERGIRIFTVGLGDVNQGSRIPVQQAGRGKSYLEYHGQQVWSKLNGGILRQVALDTGGAYIPAGTRQVDMGQVYHNYVAQVEQQDFETARINSYVPRYQWFVGLGLLLLVLDTLLPAARWRQQAAGSAVGETAAIDATAADERLRGKSATNRHSRAASSTAAAAVVIAATCLLSQAAWAGNPASAVRDANQALRAGRVDEALAGYREAEESEPGRPELLYNQAIARYRNGQYEQARHDFRQAAATADEQLDAKVRYNLANCDYAEAVQLAEKDKPAAIDHLRSAISHYRAALGANPADTDARANVQLAQMLIDRLQQEEQQKKQQQDKQKQDKQKQDKQKQDKQDQQQKKEQQQQDKQDQNKQEQDKQQQQDKQEQNKQQQDKQKQDKQKQDKQEQDKQKKQEQDKQQQGKQEQEKQPQDKQEQDKQQQDKPQDQQQQNQQEPQPDEAQPPDAQQQPAAGQPGGVPQFGHDEAASTDKSRPMTKEEAQKMLQAVRDRELMRRLQQNRQSRRRRVPVDRDW